jgi:hypothetical protein
MAAAGGNAAVAQVGGLLAPPPPRTASSNTIPLTPIAPAPTPAAPPLASAPPAAAPDDSRAPTEVADARADIASAGGLKVSKGSGILPNEHGQIWREYDISAYTQRAGAAARPEQAIVDWILRETGTEVWFSEPLGILSATPTVLRVYQTPQMHETVRGIVARFVAPGGEQHVLAVRLLTVGSPNWRTKAVSLLRPVDVKSPGVEAWLLSRENAAALHQQLSARGDFREHSAPQVEIANGHEQTLSRTQPRQYTKSVQLKGEYPFYDLLGGQIDEGYSLSISPLLSLDGRTIEAAVTCRVDQVEKLVPLAIDLPIGGQSQRVQIQVPQVVSWRLVERFRWPADEALLLSCGVVATPAKGGGGPLAALNPLAAPGRADALLLIEHHHKEQP